MAITDIAIIEKGRNVVSVSMDGLAKLWDVGESKCLADVIQANGAINCCTLTVTTEEHKVDNPREIGTEDKVLVVVCESGSVHCAHVARRAEIFRRSLEAPCNACAAVGASVVVGLASGQLVQLSLSDGSATRRWCESASPVLSLAGLSGELFLVGRQDGTCTMLSLQQKHRNIRVQLTGSDCDGIRDIAYNERWVVTACRDSLVRKYDMNQLSVHFK